MGSLWNGNLGGHTVGAKTSLYLAAAPKANSVSGGYFPNKKKIKSSEASYDADAAIRLWEISLELTHLKTV